MTLHESGVRDGDLLLLTTADVPPATRVSYDLCHAVIDASASVRGDQISRRMATVACSWAAGFGAVVLLWAGHAPVSSRAVIAAMAASAATFGSIVASRVGPEPLPSLALGLTAATLAAIAGFLAVPGGPAPPNFLLAAVVCSAVSIVLLHVASLDPTCFTSLAAFSTMAAMSAAVVAIFPAPIAAVGAMLSAASLAMLSLAAKLSIVLAGMSPTMASDDERDVRVTRATHGHQTLTGLLTGFSASAAVGTVLVAADSRDGDRVSGIALVAVVSVVLLLRARSQLGVLRSATIFIAGMVTTTAGFALAALSAPQHAHWVCLIAVVLGAGALLATVTKLATRLSPVARRSLELLEYLALGSVVPLACWVGNVFGIVRGLSLP